jgi:hypothetical protein
MPWVTEKFCREGETLRLFMIECAPVSCHELWFAVTALSDEVEGGPGVFVTLPDSVVRKGLATGWTPGVGKPDRGSYRLDVELPASERELLALQQLLEASYATAFDSPR